MKCVLFDLVFKHCNINDPVEVLPCIWVMKEKTSFWWVNWRQWKCILSVLLWILNKRQRPPWSIELKLTNKGKRNKGWTFEFSQASFLRKALVSYIKKCTWWSYKFEFLLFSSLSTFPLEIIRSAPIGHGIFEVYHKQYTY